MLAIAVETSLNPDRCEFIVPSSLTSVQHLETNRNRFICQTRCQSVLHARHHVNRLAIFNALNDDPALRFLTRAEKISGCCAWPVVFICDDGKPSVHLARCRDRLCPLCSEARSRESSYRIQSIVKQMDAPRFMTLTVPSSSLNLRVQLDRLMVSFRELRSSDSWKHYVDGGVWSLELTFNGATDQWHPHIHVIFDGRYFPQPTLKALWSQIHDENVIVDVRAVSSAAAAGRYLAKYISKVVDLDSWGAEQITEYADAMHRRRTIHTFGNCHGRAAEADPDDDSPPTSTRTIGVWVIRRRMRLGDDAARRAAAAFASSGGVLAALLADTVTDPGKLTGDELTARLTEATTWIMSLNPVDAADWKPPPERQTNRRSRRVDDRSLTEPPWHQPVPVAL